MPGFEITPELAPFVNHYSWEQNLSDVQRYGLALYRSIAAKDDLEDILFIELQANCEDWEFLDALDEASDDPVARAEAFYYLHLDSYPFWLGDAVSVEDDAELSEG